MNSSLNTSEGCEEVMEGYNVIATGFYGRRLWIDIYYCPMFLAKYKFDENMNLKKIYVSSL